MIQLTRVLLATMLLVLAFPLAISAQPTDAPVIRSTTGEPIDNLTFELEPGETSQQAFAISGEGATLRIANVSSPPNGGLTVDAGDAPLSEPASWLSLSDRSSQNRSLTVAVPSDAAPGQYIAGLVLDGEPELATSEPGIAVRQRATTFVVVTVSGEMEAGLAIGEPTIVTSGLVGVVIPMENTGTIPLAPTGALRLESAKEEAVDLPIQMGVVVAGSETSLELVLPVDIVPGEYTLSLTLADEASGARAEMPPTGIVVPQQNQEASTPASGEASPVRFRDPRVEIRGLPVTGAAIAATIVNDGSPIESATVILEVSRNGQPIDEIPLVEFERIPDGTISFSTVYAPETGFTSGLWTFHLTLEAPGEDGEPETIAQSGTIAKIDVP